MAVTFGGDSISTDNSQIEKYIGSNITSDGVLSSGIKVQESKGGGQGVNQGTYKQYHPLCHTQRPASGQQQYHTWSDYSSSRDGQGRVERNVNGGNWCGSDRFTAPVAGIYHFGGHGITNSTTNDCRMAVYVNGSYVARSICMAQGQGHGGLTNQNVNLSLAAGDYVQFGCYTSSGAHGGDWSKWGGTLIG